MSKQRNSQPPLRRDISRSVAATKNLRAISKALYEKVRAKDPVSSTQVANELSAEAISEITAAVPNLSADEIAPIERNIRRRLYDSLKVLVSIGAIRRSPRDKTLSWVGINHILPLSLQHPSISTHRTPPTDPAPSRAAIKCLRKVLVKKNNDLSQIRNHCNALQTLFERNQIHPAPPSHRLDFPFVVIRTHVATHIRLQSTLSRDILNFCFEGNYQIVNDSGIIDRLFVVGNGPPLTPLVSSPTLLPLQHTYQPMQPTHPTPPSPHQTPAPHQTPTSPPANPGHSTLFHFSNYTSGRDPAVSPGASPHPLFRRPRNQPPRSPMLDDCLRILAAPHQASNQIVDRPFTLGTPLTFSISDQHLPLHHGGELESELVDSFFLGKPVTDRAGENATQGPQLDLQGNWNM